MVIKNYIYIYIYNTNITLPDASYDAVSVHNILQLNWFYCYLFFIYSYI